MDPFGFPAFVRGGAPGFCVSWEAVESVTAAGWVSVVVGFDAEAAFWGVEEWR